MQERITTTRTADGSTTIEIEVEGDGAYDAAADAIRRAMSDKDHDRARSIMATVELAPPEPDPDPDAESDGGRRTERAHLTEDDVTRDQIVPGLGVHEVCHILREANAERDPMTSIEVAEIVRHLKPQSASGALTEAFARGLVNREPQGKKGGGKRYVYRLSDWGESELDRVGPFPYDD